MQHSKALLSGLSENKFSIAPKTKPSLPEDQFFKDKKTKKDFFNYSKMTQNYPKRTKWDLLVSVLVGFCCRVERFADDEVGFNDEAEEIIVREAAIVGIGIGVFE